MWNEDKTNGWLLLLFVVAFTGVAWFGTWSILQSNQAVAQVEK